MSYVIQNFYKLNLMTVVTPRLREAVFFKWITVFFLYVKLNNSLKKFSYFTLLSNFFFANGIFNFFYKLNFKISANYANELTKSFTYWKFKILNSLLANKFLFLTKIKLESFFLYNLYFLAIKTVNVKVTKTFFKNFFFFLLFFLSQPWCQNSLVFSFYLNFILTKNNFKIYKFYNGYFLKVYNF